MKNILIVFSILFVICSCNDDKKERISPLRLDTIHGVYEFDTQKYVGISINECIEEKNDFRIYYIVADFTQEDSCHFYEFSGKYGVTQTSFAYSFDGDNITLINKDGDMTEIMLEKREIGKDYVDYYFAKKIETGVFEYRRFNEIRNNYRLRSEFKELNGIVTVPQDRLWQNKNIYNTFYGCYYWVMDDDHMIYRKYNKNGTFRQAVKNVINYEEPIEYSNGTFRFVMQGEVDTLYLTFENGEERVECISFDEFQYFVVDADLVIGYFTDDEGYTSRMPNL